ncbi:Mss4-like protein [Podospora conica]|nr:Mss4-like protein [Schizothecium conicum]
MTGTKSNTITISCLCGAAHQTLPSPPNLPKVTLCACSSCRHLSGQLWTTYTPLTSPPTLTNLTPYSPSPSTITFYFCSTCGCHLFRRRHSQDAHEPHWEVTTGTIVSSPPFSLPEPPTITTTTTTTHSNPTTTPLPATLSRLLTPLLTPTPPRDTPPPHLPASCHCARITFTITPPSPSSLLPSSPFADLLLPYSRHPRTSTSNPASTKWWLRDPSSPSSSSALASPPRTAAPHDLRYLAGTCACRSCRLASGFEVQAWAFVPRFNIRFGPPPLAATAPPLDFSSSSSSPASLGLRSYASSPAAGAVREFCPTCGATVFWHDANRPDLIDVSVGLLRSEVEGEGEGVQPYPYLYWWTERTSFAEEVRTGRDGGMAEWAGRLVEELEGALRKGRGGTTCSRDDTGEADK